VDLIPTDGGQTKLSQKRRATEGEIIDAPTYVGRTDMADAYREALNKKHPGTVQEMLIYGSKARGQAHAESDVDIILIVKNGAKTLKRELRRIGYLLAAKTEVLPSILAYTKDEWESRRRSGSSFRKAVERDAVRVV
jgi:predicted nucleotidyltransferase